MNKTTLLLSMLILQACGAYKWWGDKSDSKTREVASESMKHIFAIEQKNFSSAIDDKLSSLHMYYLIGQQNLQQFDQIIKEENIEDIYNSEAYLKLMAVRSQAEEIEHELLEVKPENKLQREILESKIIEFSDKSDFSFLSMQNLAGYMKLNLSPKFKLANLSGAISNKDFQKELSLFESNIEFNVHEQNIEHLAQMYRVKSTKGESLINDNIFYPSSSKSGNITGNEFPEKVWSLTFDDGPGPKTSAIILKNLQNKNLKATFFQLTESAKRNQSTALAIRDAGMEIASHSYTHKDLTKFGATTVEHEITDAVKELSLLHNQEIKFFRLPYGAGTKNSAIRQKIMDNKLIHVFWNVDTLDWMAQDPQKIVERTIYLMKKTNKDAGVILFHDIHHRTAEASPYIMEFLKKDGRRVCTLNEIVSQMNEGAETVCPK